MSATAIATDAPVLEPAARRAAFRGERLSDRLAG
jgi:hypothetical protein